MHTYSAGCLVIYSAAGHGWTAASNIPDCIPLLNSQRRAVSAVPPEKQAPQIGHVSAHHRKQFRIRAARPGKALPDGKNPDIRSGHGHPSKL